MPIQWIEALNDQEDIPRPRKSGRALAEQAWLDAHPVMRFRKRGTKDYHQEDDHERPQAPRYDRSKRL
jgi:hypothetical protein